MPHPGEGEDRRRRQFPLQGGLHRHEHASTAGAARCHLEVIARPIAPLTSLEVPIGRCWAGSGGQTLRSITPTATEFAGVSNGARGGSSALRRLCGATERCAGRRWPPQPAALPLGGKAPRRLAVHCSDLQLARYTSRCGAPLVAPGQTWSAAAPPDALYPPPPSHPRRCGDGGGWQRGPAQQGGGGAAAATAGGAGGWLARAALQASAARTPVDWALRRPHSLLQEIFVINDDITVEKPIDDYYAELDKRLQGLKSQLGSDADWMPSTYEKYMTGQHQVAGSLQRNVREYYNDFKLLRADTQVRGGAGSWCALRLPPLLSVATPHLLCSRARERVLDSM